MTAEINTPYSPHKIFHHWDRIEQLRRGEQVVPLQVQLIISDLCNQNCSFCAYRMDGYSSNQLFAIIDPKTGEKNNNPARFIPYPKVIEILDDCVEMGVKAIQVTGGGEPTVHPKHKEIFEYIVKSGLQLGLVSNFAILRDGVLNAFKHENAQWVRVSIDAGLPATYSYIREVSEAMYHKVLENITQLVKIRNEYNPNLVIGIGFVVTKDNFREVVLATEKAKEWGVDNIRLSAIFTEEDIDYFDGFWDEANQLCKEAKKLETPTFKVFNLFDDRSADLQLKHPDYKFCGYQELNTYIGGDLNVYRCCNLAYNEKGKLGSLVGQRFKDFWVSQEKTSKICGFNAKTCPRCMFNGKNKQILYAIEPNPKHVNFV